MSRLTGTRKARARARAHPDILDHRVRGAIADTVEQVHRSGRANIDAMLHRRSGRLRRYYGKAVRKRYHQTIGLVGYITRTARRQAFYARFVHDGTRFALAHPFHDLAIAEEMAPHGRRMRQALRRTLDTRAAPSDLARTGRWGKVEGV